MGPASAVLVAAERSEGALCLGDEIQFSTDVLV